MFQLVEKIVDLKKIKTPKMKKSTKREIDWIKFATDVLKILIGFLSGLYAA